MSKRRRRGLLLDALTHSLLMIFRIHNRAGHNKVDIGRLYDGYYCIQAGLHMYRGDSTFAANDTVEHWFAANAIKRQPRY